MQKPDYSNSHDIVVLMTFTFLIICFDVTWTDNKGSITTTHETGTNLKFNNVLLTMNESIIVATKTSNLVKISTIQCQIEIIKCQISHLSFFIMLKAIEIRSIIKTDQGNSHKNQI